MVEPKGVDAFEIDSKSNFIFTTNKLHSVPATGDERRFFPLCCGDGNKQDSSFFGALMAEMEAGGYAALLFDLLERDISATDFARPPATKLLSTQILESMIGLERWWASVLSTGRLAFARAPAEGADENDIEWPEGGAWVAPTALVQESANLYARDFAGPPTPEGVGKFLALNVPGLTRTRRQNANERQHCYTFPALEDCRDAFVKARPGLSLEDVSDPVPLADPEPADQSAPNAGAETGHVDRNARRRIRRPSADGSGQRRVNRFLSANAA
jgi:hypothetical protein